MTLDRLRGIAYTIDPVYEAEVRDYLGTKISLYIRAQLTYFYKDYREKVCDWYSQKIT